MSQTPTFALLVGNDDYRPFDPSGRQDLRGAVADAVGWHRLCLSHLRIPKRNVQLLKNASKEEMLDGLRCLGLRLDTDEERAALVAFSGHGLGLPCSDSSEEGTGLALCPSDMTELVVDQVVTLQDVLGVLSPRALARITFVLDACYSDGGRTVRSLGNAPAAPTHVPSLTRSSARLFLASYLGEEAYEFETSQGWRGALSFALQTLLRRWSTTVDPATEARYFRVSNDVLCFRARQLLGVLGVPQTPTLVLPQDRLALLPVLRPGTALVAGQVAAWPDGELDGEEMSPGYDGVIVLELQAQVSVSGPFFTVGFAVLPGTNPGSSSHYHNAYDDTHETWYFDTGLISQNLAGFVGCRLKGAFKGQWGTGEIPVIEVARQLPQEFGPWNQATNWSVPGARPINTSPAGTNLWYTHLYQGTDGDQVGFAVQFCWGNGPPGNPDRGRVTAVYYYSADGTNVLLHPAAGAIVTLSNTDSITSGWKIAVDA